MPPWLPALVLSSSGRVRPQREGFDALVQEGSLLSLLVGAHEKGDAGNLPRVWARASPEREEEVPGLGCGSSDLLH